MKKIAFLTFGCKLNYAETMDLKQRLEGDFDIVEWSEDPDFVIINSCTVTNNADKENFQTIRKIYRHNPQIKLVVTGCQAQLHAKLLSALPNVVGVFGNQDKEKIVDFVKNFNDTDAPTVEVSDLKRDFEFHHAYAFSDRTRCFLKVQDGCNYHCSFCATCLARGNSRSTTLEKTLADVKSVQERGVKEIILTGVNLGDVGLIDNKREYNFFDLLQGILKQGGEARIRISSIEVNLLTKEIIDLVSENPRIVNHFHVPLQSGNDEILKSMRRRYMSQAYKEKILYIAEKTKDCCIGADVIVGYPGETEEKFQETYEFIQKLPLNYLHVFPFSKRDGTLAATYEDLDWEIKKRRVNILRQLSQEKKIAFYKQNVGKVVEVLFEHTRDKTGKMIGFSNNYIRVIHEFDPEMINKLVPFEILEVDEDRELAMGKILAL